MTSCRSGLHFSVVSMEKSLLFHPCGQRELSLSHLENQLWPSTGLLPAGLLRAFTILLVFQEGNHKNMHIFQTYLAMESFIQETYINISQVTRVPGTQFDKPWPIGYNPNSSVGTKGFPSASLSRVLFCLSPIFLLILTLELSAHSKTCLIPSFNASAYAVLSVWNVFPVVL